MDIVALLSVEKYGATFSFSLPLN